MTPSDMAKIIRTVLCRGLSFEQTEHILRVMESVKGNKVSAAKILGLDRRALYRRLERYGIGTIERRPKQGK